MLYAKCADKSVVGGDAKRSKEAVCARRNFEGVSRNPPSSPSLEPRQEGEKRPRRARLFTLGSSFASASGNAIKVHAQVSRCFPFTRESLLRSFVPPKPEMRRRASVRCSTTSKSRALSTGRCFPSRYEIARARIQSSTSRPICVDTLSADASRLPLRYMEATIVLVSCRAFHRPLLTR